MLVSTRTYNRNHFDGEASSCRSDTTVRFKFIDSGVSYSDEFQDENPWYDIIIIFYVYPLNHLDQQPYDTSTGLQKLIRYNKIHCLFLLSIY